MRKMQELEREKAKLEVVVEQEKDRTSSLKKELEHTIQVLFIFTIAIYL